ncbi:MAG: hypothetical protein EZS28_000124 [Streblomastix strix]|uniref:Uncharacterized protein n=1 Tax=Streblomastix strix TaxID=222440 RepID=A0A5J4XAN4_9EUKA|nr:MAG: hypothetical protein EZS28_000124 [Streblomastix strix]
MQLRQEVYVAEKALKLERVNPVIISTKPKGSPHMIQPKTDTQNIGIKKLPPAEYPGSQLGTQGKQQCGTGADAGQKSVTSILNKFEDGAFKKLIDLIQRKITEIYDVIIANGFEFFSQGCFIIALLEEAQSTCRFFESWNVFEQCGNPLIQIDPIAS